LEEVSRLVTRKLETMAKAADWEAILSKRKAISTLLPYAIRLAGGGQQQMIDAFSRTARASNSGEFMWRCVGPVVDTLFDEPSTPSLDRVITLLSPHLDYFNENKVTRWSTAALETVTRLSIIQIISTNI